MFTEIINNITHLLNKANAELKAKNELSDDFKKRYSYSYFHSDSFKEYTKNLNDKIEEYNGVLNILHALQEEQMLSRDDWDFLYNLQHLNTLIASRLPNLCHKPGLRG
jgi:hypothetical protein